MVTAGNHLALWDLASGKIRLSHAAGPGGHIVAAAFERESTRFAAVRADLESSELILVDLGGMTVQSFGMQVPFGVFGELIFWKDAQHLLEANPLSLGLTLYRIGEGKLQEEMKLLLLEDGEGIFFDPSGAYWSTLEGDRYLVWQQGLEVSRIRQFRDAYYSPGRIRDGLAGRAPAGRLPPPMRPPRVEIRSPSFPALGSLRLEKNRLELVVRVEGESSIRSVVVVVNGVKTRTIAVGVATADLSVVVDSLHYGHNWISVVALDERRNTSYPSSHSVYVETASDSPPNLVFLGIAATGAEEGHPLHFARPDAELLASRFSGISPGRYWRTVRAEVLPRSEVSPVGIERSLAKQASRLAPDDLLVVYLVGHGSRRSEKGELLFLTEKGWLRWVELAGWLGRVRSRVLLLVDTCQSGALVAWGERMDSHLVTAELLDGRDSGMQVISAAQSWRDASESNPLQHSFFAMALSHAFGAEADFNRDGVVSLRELQEFVRTEVERLSGEEYAAGLKDLTRQVAGGHGADPPTGFDQAFADVIQIPQSPWFPPLDELEDIPLIPIEGKNPQSFFSKDGRPAKR